MTADLHPEELLDRARTEELSDRDRARLDAHLSQCDACAFELLAGSDFEGLGQAEEEGDEAMRERVLASIGRELIAERASQPIPIEQAPRIRRSRFATGVAAAAIVLAVGVGAAAAMFLGERLFAPDTEPQSAATDTERGPSESTTEDAAIHLDEVRIDGVGRRRAARERPSPAQIYQQANEARRAGDAPEAASLYRRVQREFPESREAQTSRVALGRLLLDRLGRPGRARAEFDAYLSEHPNGTLALEARVGRALALRRLGRRAAERDAWREVIARHPSTPSAQRARDRLSQLEADREAPPE